MERTTVNEKKRRIGKMDKAENKARTTAGKTRAKESRRDVVSDQKSHGYH